MDFYIAALGRSGSTALANWLTTPPDHVVFHEPNLLAAESTRLLRLQLADWGMSEEQAFAGHWSAKETLSELHDAMIDRFEPAKVLLGVRNPREAALSLFEKHRRQGLLERYSDEWTADYVVREADGLVRLAERLEREERPVRIVRYEEFGEEMLRSVAAWVGWPGGGDMARGFEDFGRAFETDRDRSREFPPELCEQADRIAGRCAAFQQRFYGR